LLRLVSKAAAIRWIEPVALTRNGDPELVMVRPLLVR
jgi:hypothetical protein